LTVYYWAEHSDEKLDEIGVDSLAASTAAELAATSDEKLDEWLVGMLVATWEW
jgi:hypothetical protein